MDEFNGLIFMRSRHYAPTLGRFVQKDSIGFSGGINLFRYADSDPIGKVDPEGTFLAWVTGTGWVVLFVITAETIYAITHPDLDPPDLHPPESPIPYTPPAPQTTCNLTKQSNH